MVHDGEPLAEPVGLVHVVGGQDERRAPLVQPAQRLPEEPPGLRVEAGRGLVEEHHLRVVHQGARDHHALLLPARERERLRARLVRDLQLGEQPVGSRLALCGREAEVPAVVGQHLADGEVAVEVAGLRHDRDPALRLLRLPRDVHPVHEDPPGGGPHERADAADRRALPAPFGPSRPKNSPRSTVNEMPRTASTGGVFRVPGYVFTRFSTTRMLMAERITTPDEHRTSRRRGPP